MCGRVCLHGTNDAQVIREFGRVWEQAADFEPASAVMAKLEWRLHQVPDGSSVGADLGFPLIGLSVPLGQCRLGIECIYLARPAVHEQEDAMFGFGGEMGGLRSQRVESTRGMGRRLGARKEAVARESVDECQASKAATDLPQKLPPSASTRRWVGNESGVHESIGVYKLVEIENHPTELFECGLAGGFEC